MEVRMNKIEADIAAMKSDLITLNSQRDFAGAIAASGLEKVRLVSSFFI